jgi:hypothetical protein
MARRIILTNDFRDNMYDNMWTFMNLDMINYIFNNGTSNGFVQIDTETIRGINNDNFTQRYANTITYKTGNRGAGHYVYVDNNLVGHSTYEDNLLTRPEDDGICHGAAMIYALQNNGSRLFTLISNPRNRDERKENYKTILEFYIYLIESGMWDKALEEYFYGDVTWITVNRKRTTQESQIALSMLQNYIDRFR